MTGARGLVAFAAMARRLRRERLLLGFAALAAVLGLLDARPWRAWLSWLDLPTWLGLLALLLSIEGIRASGEVQRAAQILTRRARSERALALMLVGASMLLAMVLTNDISLFLLVPLTLELGRGRELPRRRLVIFEALGVNAGSTLSPVGSPQNLLLWRHSGLSMPGFMLHMLPVFGVMAVLLLAAVWRSFAPRPLAPQPARAPGAAPPRRALGAVSAAVLPVVLVLLQTGHAAWAAVLAVGVFVLGFRDVLRRVDWALLATLAAMFLALGHLAQWPPLQQALQHLARLPGDWTFALGVLLSQVISNVPAAVVLRAHAPDLMVLAAAVNVGGFGLGIGSLANLIALRLEGSPGALAAFHRISVPFALLCAPLVWLALRLSA